MSDTGDINGHGNGGSAIMVVGAGNGGDVCPRFRKNGGDIFKQADSIFGGYDYRYRI